MSRDGTRPGAGRKTNAEIAQVRELIDSVASPEEWKAVFANLFEIARTDKGHAAIAAAQLLCRYRFGVPAVQEPEPERDIVPIQYIEVDPIPNVRDDGDLDGEPVQDGDEMPASRSDRHPGRRPAPSVGSVGPVRRDGTRPAGGRSVKPSAPPPGGPPKRIYNIG